MPATSLLQLIPQRLAEFQAQATRTLPGVFAYLSDQDGLWMVNAAGIAVPVSGGGGGGAVSSVFARTGNVVALADDYDIAKITGLTAALAGKAPTVHTHAEADVTGLVADLAGKAPTVHTHAQADVTNLVSDLAGKAPTVHAHAQADVTNLVSDLAGKQPLDADLTALAALAANGLLARTGSGTVAARTLTPGSGLSVANGDGVSGNPTVSLDADLAAIAALAGTGLLVRTAADTWAQRSLAAGAGIALTNADGVAGNPSIAVTRPYVASRASGDSSAITGTSIATFDASHELPAGLLNVVGAVLDVDITGYFSTDASPGNLAMSLVLNQLGVTADVIATFSGLALPASQSNAPWRVRAKITTRTTGASGKVQAGSFEGLFANGASLTVVHTLSPFEPVVDLTDDLVVELQAQFDNSGNSISIRTFNIIVYPIVAATF